MGAFPWLGEPCAQARRRRCDLYDLIGDIHGHADALRRLLATLGYTRHQGGYRHSDRRAIFLGDFIDRGPG
jgi:hypothetical protein